MPRVSKFVALLAGLHLVAWTTAGHTNGGPGMRGPVLLANRVLDARTVIKPSAIPGSGNGLYAVVRIKAGEVIGELGGQLLEEPDLNNPSAYLAGLDDCATQNIPPYRYLDSKDYGGHVSRANFAPKAINGRETNFQNAKIERRCEAPYVVFVATKDIEPGTEIWASYGPHYGYERFMHLTPVKNFFCGLLNMDCSQNFEFEP